MIDDDSSILRAIENNLSSDEGVLYIAPMKLKKQLD
jgi:hypothetical protein